MKILNLILNWQSWFEPERFLDTLIIPASVAAAFVILKIESNKNIRFLINKVFNAERPLVNLKELSGLKIFAIWNLLLGIGLIMFGFTYNKSAIYGIAAVSFFGASLGWSYAFKYFEEAWQINAVILKLLSSLFLILAIAEKIANIYKGNIDLKSLFYFTIPPLILLLYSKTKKDTDEQSRLFWLSSFTFNLVLVGIFFIDGVGAVKNESPSTIKFWLNLFLIIAPTLASYISLINIQKYYRIKAEGCSSMNRGLIIIAFTSLISLTLLASFGIKNALLTVQYKRAEYKSKTELITKEFQKKYESNTATNPH